MSSGIVETKVKYFSQETALLTSITRTTVGGQFGWGGTRLKMYQPGPKVSSNGSEIRCRVQEQKLA